MSDEVGCTGCVLYIAGFIMAVAVLGLAFKFLEWAWK